MDLKEALEVVQARHGTLTAEIVVKEAESPDSPLHRYFAWDDEEAAHQYRLFQARALIRRVKVAIQATPDRIVRVRAYTHVRSERAYVPTAQALERNRNMVLDQARLDLAALRRKYENLIDFDTLLQEELLRRQSQLMDAEIDRVLGEAEPA